MTKRRIVRWGQPPYEKRRQVINTNVPETWFLIRFKPLAEALHMSYSNTIALILKQTLMKHPWWLQKIVKDSARGKTIAQIFKDGEAALIEIREKAAQRDYVYEIKMEEEAASDKMNEERENRFGRNA